MKVLAASWKRFPALIRLPAVMFYMIGMIGMVGISIMAATASEASAAERPSVFVQLGHWDSINAVSFSPDGSFLVTAGGDGALKLWEVATGREIKTFSGHEGSVRSAAFTPDGRGVVSAGADTTVRLWEVATGRQAKIFRGHSDYVSCVAVSPDGRYALSGGGDRTLRLWDIDSGREVRAFKGHTDAVTSVAFSPDGQYAVSGSFDRTVRLWRVANGRSVRTLKGHTDNVWAVAVSPDGRYVLSGGQDGTVRLWDAAGGRQLRSFATPPEVSARRMMESSVSVSSVAFSPDGRFALADGGLIEDNKLWEVATGRFVRSFEAFPPVAFSPDGRFVLGGWVPSGEDPREMPMISALSLRMFELNTGRRVRSFAGHRLGLLKNALFSPGSDYALTGAVPDGFLKLWDMRSGRLVRAFTGYEPVAFTPDGRYVLSRSDHGMAPALTEIESGRQVRTFDQMTEFDRFVSFSADGRYILSYAGQYYGADNSIRVWNAANGKPLGAYRGHTEPVVSARFSTDLRYVVSASDDGTARIWDAPSGRVLHVLSGHTGPVTSAAFDAQGRLAVTGSQDKTARVWDVADGSQLKTFQYPHPVRSVAFTPGGRALVEHGEMIAGEVPPDIKVTLLDLTRDRAVAEVSGGGPVTMSRDGRLFMTWGSDEIVHVWDATTGAEICKLVSFARHVWDDAAGKTVLKNNEWIVITSEGYYSSSLRGHQYLSVSLGNRVYGINQFYDVFYRPDLVKKKLTGEDLSRYISGITLERALADPPPEVAILSPGSGDTFSERTVPVTVRVKGAGGGIGDIRLYHNGKLVASRGVYRVARRGPEPAALPGESETRGTEPAGKSSKPAAKGGEPTADSPERSPYQAAERGITYVKVRAEGPALQLQADEVTPLTGSFEHTYQVELVSGENTISAAAFNGTNTITSVLETVTVTGDLPRRSPRLFAVVVGNNHFAESRYDLMFAVKDASDFAGLLEKAGGPLFSEVRVRLLKDAAKPEVLSAVAASGEAMHPEDVFVFYAASHGRAEDDLYYIYTAEFDGDPERAASFISSVELMEAAKAVPALRHLYILDTCQAGGVGAVVSGLYDARISVLAKALGMHIIAGAKTTQGAVDNYQGNGLFTHFVLRAMAGAADEDRNREVNVFELTPYLSREVKQASRGRQEPFIRNFGDDFPMARVP